MKTINKVTFFIFSIIAFSNLSTHCLFYNDGRPSGALTGAAIGGLAGGRKGAGIGLGVGLATDVMSNAAANDRRRYDDDRYYDDDGYYNRRYSRRYRRSKPSYRNLQNENEALKRQLNEYENQNN